MFVGLAMPGNSRPSISAVVAAYQAQEWIAEAVESILGQTRPPDEVVVVDDGSTDGTARELERFGERIRVVRRPNGGCPAAFNTAFAEARGDFVAMCGADDIWEPHKLEWQEQAIAAHPEADVFFGHARLIGRIEAEHSRPPDSGLLDSSAFRDALFRECCVCASSVLIRRSRFEHLGPFIEDFGNDDWEYWFRCLRAGVRFYYDQRPLACWRQHESNITRRTAWMDECAAQVRSWYAADVTGRAIAEQLFRTGRRLVEEGDPRGARQAFRQSLRHGLGDITSVAGVRRGGISSAAGVSRGGIASVAGVRGGGIASDTNARALVWVIVLGLPAGIRERMGRQLTGASRALDHLSGGRGRAPSPPSP